MQAKSNILSEKEFCHELVNRFFQSNSYFMHCIKHVIDTSVDEASHDTEEDYLLLGNLIDKLVNAEDKIREIEALSEVEGFDVFQNKLFDGVKHLRVAELDAEKMKIEIERLAQNLFNVTFKVIGNDVSRHKLKDFLGAPHSEPEEQISESIESPSKVPVLSEPDLVEVQHIASISDEDKDSLHFSDTDVKEVGGFEDSDSEEGGSNLFDSQKSVQGVISVTLNSDDVNPEPESLVTAFRRDVQNKLNQLEKSLNSIAEQPGRLSKCAEIFEEISSAAMIYGFDSFETMACKASLLIKRTVESKVKLSFTLAALSQVCQIMLSLLEQGPELTDADSIKRGLDLLSEPDAALAQVDMPPLEQDPELTDADAIKKGFDLLAKSDAALAQVEPSQQLKKKPTEPITDFKLPGEDDDEIHSLVQEIRSEPMHRSKSSSSMTLSGFKEEAKIFFIVIEEAIRVLETRLDDQEAFEDIQLASHSLIEIASKYHNELVKIPELLLKVAHNVNSVSYLISETDHQLLSETFKQYQNLATLEDLSHPDMESMVELLASLNLKIEMLSKESEHAVSQIVAEDSTPPIDVLR